MVIVGGTGFLYYQTLIKDKVASQVLANQAAALRSLEEGPDEFQIVQNFIPRKELANKFTDLLTHWLHRPEYNIIVGESGTGKTTLIQHILNQLKKPRGAIYMNCELIFESDDYLEAFKDAIGFKYNTTRNINGMVLV